MPKAASGCILALGLGGALCGCLPYAPYAPTARPVTAYSPSYSPGYSGSYPAYGSGYGYYGAPPAPYNVAEPAPRPAKASAPKRLAAVPVVVVPAATPAAPPASMPDPSAPAIPPAATPAAAPAAPECRTVTQLGYADGKETQRHERYCRVPPGRDWVRS